MEKVDSSKLEAGVVAVDAASIKSSENSAVPDDSKYATTSAAHRHLESYHVNLIAMGGSIGTATFVYIGSGLTSAGPLGLLLGYTWWTVVIYIVAMCQMEMVTFWPTDMAFARNAARYIDDAWGVCAGWCFWTQVTCTIAYEVTAATIVIDYWPAALAVHPAVFISIILVTYFLMNIWDSRYFGHAEFGFSIAKILLSFGLLAFTFITMVGGNPVHDKFGFRYWREPGLFADPYPAHGKTLSNFEAFLSATRNAAFTVCGPEYITSIAGEARSPRTVMPKAFRSIIWRLVLFFIGGALSVGILVPYNSTELLNAISTGAAGAAKSPYVVAMNRLRIHALPHIINAVILSSIYSAGNAYVFLSARGLAQMARDGYAPKILSRRNRRGVPWIAVCVVGVVSLVSYCQVASSAQIAITWITSLVTANTLMTSASFVFTWIKFDRGMKAQGIPRSSLPARSRILPYAAYFALPCQLFVILMQGYPVFLKGGWDVSTFIQSYLPVAAFPILFVVWKFIKKTKWKRSADIDFVTYIDDPAFDDQPDENRSRLHRFLKRVF
ncbi:hypothetical protein JCM6882_007867 [Rhodosporidiobolus microsporus]